MPTTTRYVEDGVLVVPTSMMARGAPPTPHAARGGAEGDGRRGGGRDPPEFRGGYSSPVPAAATGAIQYEYHTTTTFSTTPFVVKTVAEAVDFMTNEMASSAQIADLLGPGPHGMALTRITVAVDGHVRYTQTLRSGLVAGDDVATVYPDLEAVFRELEGGANGPHDAGNDVDITFTNAIVVTRERVRVRPGSRASVATMGVQATPPHYHGNRQEGYERERERGGAGGGAGASGGYESPGSRILFM
jgi:hypothetical protein